VAQMFHESRMPVGTQLSTAGLAHRPPKGLREPGKRPIAGLSKPSKGATSE